MRPSTSAILTFLLLTVPMLGPGMSTSDAAASNRLWVCAQVVDEAGSPLEGATVRAITMNAGNLGDNVAMLLEDPRYHAETGADGWFSLELYRLKYRFQVEGPVDANGPLYQPVLIPGGTSDKDLSTEEEQTGACHGGASNGVPLNGGTIVLTAHGDVQVQPTGTLRFAVTDGVAQGTPPLPGVTINGHDGQTLPSVVSHTFSATTDTNGEATVACASGTQVDYRLSLAGYLDALVGTPCTPGETVDVPVKLWRKPLAVVVTVQNATDVVETVPSAAVTEAIADQESHLSGQTTFAADATVRVASVGGDLRDLSGDGLCDNREVAESAVVTRGDTPPYRCEATTGEDRTATLRLPWTDAAPNALTLEATAPGHAPATATIGINRAKADAGVPEYEDMHLTRPAVTISGQVVDAQKMPIAGAIVDLSNLTSYHRISTDATGGFQLTLPVGPYNLEVQAPGHGTQWCQVEVGVDGNGDGTLSARGSNDAKPCLMLVQSGASLVEGFVVDGETSIPVPGLAICTKEDGTEACDTTDADGRYAFELAPRTRYKLYTSAGSAWQFDTSPPSGTTPAENTARTAATENLQRTKIPVRIEVRDGAGATLQGADVDVFQESTRVSGTTGNVTGADGQILLNLTWTRHATLSAFNTSDYMAQARHHRDLPHYTIQASSAFSVDDASEFIPIVLNVQENYRSTAVTVTDLHTGQPIGVTVTATVHAGGMATIACGPTCTTTAPGALDLYDDHVYKICVDEVGYLTASGSTDSPFCATGVTAGSAVHLDVRRTPISVTLELRDPHSDAPIDSVPVQLAPGPAGGPACDPTSLDDFDCDQDTTNGRGQANFVVPWFGQGEFCFRVDAGNYDVAYATLGDLVHMEENVPFQAVEICPEFSKGTTSVNWPVRPLRQATAGAIKGTITDAVTGAAFAGALVEAVSDRPGFVCAPTAHNSTQPFTGCAATADAAGEYTLGPLPAKKIHTSTAGQTWGVRASAPDHHAEQQTFISFPPSTTSRFDLALWPSKFEAVITVVDQHGSARSPCDHAEGRQVTVRLTDLETGVAQETVATMRDDDACEAAFMVEDWNRAAQPMPAGTPAWPKQTDLFRVETVFADHAGHALVQLGPKRPTHTLQMWAYGTGTAETATYRITGRILDADASANQPLVGGAVTGMLVKASPANPCADAEGDEANTFYGVSDSSGAYTIPVACPGDYTLEFTDTTGRLYQPAQPASVRVSAAGATNAPDVEVLRTRVPLTVHVRSHEGNPVVGVTVTVTGIDVTHPADADRTGSSGTAHWPAVPWGRYAAAYAAPPGHVPVFTPSTLYVSPPGSVYYAIYQS